MRLLATLPLLLAIGTIGCGPSSNVRGGDATDGGRSLPDFDFDRDAFWAEDPPPRMCSLDGGMLPPPPTPGGTPECPDDKNREGCPCPTAGMTAACWPGLRANRNLGVCTDGTTTCEAISEHDARWGRCRGYVAPTPGTTDGRLSCQCFSRGQWALQTVSICFARGADNVQGGGGACTAFLNAGKGVCPGAIYTQTPPDWTTDTLRADCAGRFTLCVTVKAGDSKNPQPDDCTLGKSCVSVDYTVPGVEQTLPPLRGWIATSASEIECAKDFAANGGYGEMSVNGDTAGCDHLDRTFARYGYCPLICSSNPSADPRCATCVGGGGTVSF